jgi:anti-sigma regulatory factor (Ser/Thr protein kinase)
MTSPAGTGVTVTLAADVHAPKFARDYAARFLGRLDPDFIETAKLVVSELVTNAVEHTYGRRPVELVMAARENDVYLAVRDYARGVPMRALEPHAKSSGRGLMIVDALADRWGWHAVSGGKIVWCSIGFDG